MKDYTTGRAARELRVSQNRLRALCQAGMIAARATPGGHFRIPKSEIDRLRRDGVPDPPPATPTEDELEPINVPMTNPVRHPTLLAEPSDQTIAAADDVVRLENEVRGIQLKRAREENLDWFRERQRKEAETKAVREQQRLESRAIQLRRHWENTWIEYALEIIPEDAPESFRLPVSEFVREALAGLNPNDPEEVTEPLIRAAVDRGLRPWQRSKEIKSAIQEAQNQLPYWAKTYPGPSEWELKAIHAASHAISELRNDATTEEMRAAAIEAGRAVASDYQHAEECRRLVQSVFLLQTPDEQETARQAVKAALDKLPVGIGRTQMERVRDDALAPFKAAEADFRVNAQAACQADSYLLHVDSHLDKIAADPHSDLSLGNFSDRCRLAQELKQEIRPIVIEEILTEPLTLDEANTLIDSLVDRSLSRNINYQ
ncbi:MAG: helix-turn-helix domain-containing protein [Acidobacteriia bacterium]|nr:helix-turn-helix domain-containing protein [Terriglobia bacterium]